MATSAILSDRLLEIFLAILTTGSHFILHTAYFICILQNFLDVQLLLASPCETHIVSAACWCTFTTANLVAGSVQCTVHWCVGSWCEPYLVPKSISPCWSSSSILPPSEHCTVHSAHLPERGFHRTCPCKVEFTALNTCSPQMVQISQKGGIEPNQPSLML